MKIGFLGCGNMGGALARAVRRADPSAVIILSDTDKRKRDALAADFIFTERSAGEKYHT